MSTHARRLFSRPTWRDAAPTLLLAFATNALAVVGAVGWAIRIGNWWVTAAAVALMLVLTGALLRWLTDFVGEQSRLPAHPNATWAVPALAAAALLLPLGLPSVVHPGVRGGSSPEGTVRSFLGAVVDGDGIGACSYVSDAARLEVDAGGSTCESYFGGASLRIGTQPIVRDSQLDGLHYAVRAAGPDRIVTVTTDGGSLSFRLHPATTAERDEFHAPATPWRIDSNPTKLRGRT